MAETGDRNGARTDRRAFLRRLAGATALTAAGLSARAAFAEDAALDALIGDTQRDRLLAERCGIAFALVRDGRVVETVKVK